MRKTLAITFIIFLAFFVWNIFYFVGQRDKTDLDETFEVEYLQEGRAFRIIDEDGETVLEYSIDNFVSWASENWEDIFETPPMFSEEIEETKVMPEDFTFFDRTVKISPQQEKFAFSVHRYFAASTMSFVGIFDIDKKEVSLVKSENRGGVQNFYWSDDENYIAYVLDTARAGGDFLTVDDAENTEKMFTLSGEDILSFLNGEGNYHQEDHREFMPEFRGVNWQKERLYFTTNDYDGGDSIEWSVDVETKNLRREKLSLD